MQLNCDFDEESGGPKAPADPYSVGLGCKPGTRKGMAKIYTQDGKGLMSGSYIMTCTHSKRQLNFTAGAGERWVNGRRVSFGGAQPYAGWQFKHNMTVTLDFNDIAKRQGADKPTLMKRLMTDGIDKIVYNDDCYDTMDELDSDCLFYCLWSVAEK